MQRFDSAIASYERALAIDPQCRAALLGMGVAAARQQRFDTALDWFNSVIAADPDDPRNAEAFLNRGNVLRATGRTEEAVSSYMKATTLRPGYADALFNLGVIEYERGRPDAARERFHEALRSDPDHPQAARALKALRNQP
jgi:tetratricopeptide (TPR) repeat protein